MQRFLIRSAIPENLARRRKSLLIEERIVASLVMAKACGSNRILTLEFDPPLPEDVAIGHVDHDLRVFGWTLTLYHPSFDEVSFACEAPRIETRCRIVELKPEPIEVARSRREAEEEEETFTEGRQHRPPPSNPHD